jgi:hypothetical protein
MSAIRRARRHIDEGRTMMHMAIGMLAALGPLQVFIGDEHGRNALEPTASHATSGSDRTPRESPQSNGMAEAFVRTIKRVRVSPRPDAETVISCQLGSPTTTRFTRTRLSVIVHPVSSSQLTQDPDCVRSFGGYNNSLIDCVN